MTDSVAAAVARIEAFLESRSRATSIDPEILASHNGRELRASDLRVLLDAAKPT